MTLYDIMRMAREAGGSSVNFNGRWMFYGSDLERFAALIAANEREACAKVCEGERHIEGQFVANEFAAAIRARGNAE